MSPVAGVDGGGSGTRALVLDESGRELGSGTGPPGLVRPDAVEAAADAVEEAVRAAAAAAGVELPLVALWCGLAGAGRPEGRGAVEEALEGRGLAREVGVGTDAAAAFRDAFGPEGRGLLLIAGTGSIALGRSSDGETLRVGGWGALLGDEGSGYRIGLEGLRTVLRAEDGRGPATELRDRLLTAADVDEPADLVDYAARADKPTIGALAPEVVRAADVGDEAAVRIVDHAVRDLTAHVEALVRALGTKESTPDVVLAGGLAGPGGPLRDRLTAALRRTGHPVAVRAVRAERGAARIALDEVR